jgi:hypothetical protein
VVSNPFVNSWGSSGAAIAWITAYTESLAQQRRDIAPIDEPCYQWLLALNDILVQEIDKLSEL